MNDVLELEMFALLDVTQDIINDIDMFKGNAYAWAMGVVQENHTRLADIFIALEM